LEVLLSMAVLALLLVLVVSLIRGTTDAVERSRRDLALGAKARDFFDGMASDLSRRQALPDSGVTVAFRPGTGNGGQDAVFLLLSTRGFSAPSWQEARLAAVRYAAGEVPAATRPSHGIPALTKRMAPLLWEAEPPPASGPVFTALAAEVSTGVPSLTAESKGGVAGVALPGLVRLVVMAHTVEGEVVPLTDPALAGQAGDPPGLVLARDRIVAFTLGLALVGEEALASYRERGGDFSALAAVFPVPGNNKLPLESWQLAANPSIAGSLAALDPRILREIRFYQRTFPVP
jgi:type II secretory pathway pseudopilin PulG